MVEQPADSEHVLTRADQATVDALRPGTALLVVLRGPNTGARFLLDDDEVSSGRHPDSDIFLDDVTVSRKHAVFSRTDRGFVVRDVGSLNGTYVNGPASTRRSSPPETRSRSGSSGSSSTPARTERAGPVVSSRPAGRLTIGAVLDELREEFPEVSISKIRFLETEGLITPPRTGSGYRPSSRTTSSGSATSSGPSGTGSGRCGSSGSPSTPSTVACCPTPRPRTAVPGLLGPPPTPTSPPRPGWWRRRRSG